MKKLDIVIMIQEGLAKLSDNLLMVAQRLEKIERMLAGKNSLGTAIGNSYGNPVENSCPDEKLDKAQAAKILKVSVRTLDRYRKKGIIPYSQYNDGGKVTFRYKDLAAVRDKRTGNNHARDHFSESTDTSNQ